MAYGRPVVATRVGGLADLDGDGVLLVEPGDLEALRWGVTDLLDDAGQRGRAAAAARGFAAQHFSLDVSAAALLSAYVSALGRRGR